MPTSFRTRTRGTKRQIGKKFPITLMKMKLPNKITIKMVGGKVRPPQFAAVKRNEKDNFEIVKYFKTYSEAADWVTKQKEPGVRIIGKNLFKNFTESDSDECKTKRGGKSKPFIWYAGEKCLFEAEVPSTDEAQSLLDYYRRIGYKAACLHERGKHQVYVEEPKHKGGKILLSSSK